MQPRVRATAVCVQDGHLLALKQAVTESSARVWSLPGGGLEFGESVAECLIREMAEETGLDVEVGDLLYVCDRLQDNRHVLHLTFEVTPVGGRLHLGEEPESDANPIHDVRWIPVDELSRHGFSSRFAKLVQDGFPDRGSYRGSVENIGL